MENYLVKTSTKNLNILWGRCMCSRCYIYIYGVIMWKRKLIEQSQNLHILNLYTYKYKGYLRIKLYK